MTFPSLDTLEKHILLPFVRNVSRFIRHAHVSQYFQHKTHLLHTLANNPEQVQEEGHAASLISKMDENGRRIVQYWLGYETLDELLVNLDKKTLKKYTDFKKEKKSALETPLEDR